MKKTTKIAAAMMAAAMTAGLLAGCGSSNEPTSAAPTTQAASEAGGEAADADSAADIEGEAPAASYEGRTLKLLLTYSKEKTVLYECLDEFTAQTGIALDIQYMPLGDMRKQVNIMVTGNSLPDVMDVDNTDTYAYAKMGILQDITDKVEAELPVDQYYPDVLSMSKVDGKYYGLPFTSNNLCLYYNADALAAAGIEAPPATWDELLAACAALKEQGMLGFAASAGQNTDTPFHYFPFLWQAGGASGEDTDLGSEQSLAALTFYKTLIDEGYMPKEVATYNAADIANQFSAGNIAMMVDGPWRLNGVKNDAGFEFGIAELPAGEGGKASVLGGHNFAVVANDNADISWEFVKFMNSPEIMAKYSEAENYIPARRDVAEASEYFSAEPIHAFIEMAANAKMKPCDNFSKVNDIMVEMVQSVVIGQKTPQEAVQDAADAQAALK